MSAATVKLADTVTEEAPTPATTDDKGRYSFTSLLPGNYQIWAEKDGRRSDFINIKVGPEASAGPVLRLNAGGK